MAEELKLEIETISRMQHEKKSLKALPYNIRNFYFFLEGMIRSAVHFSKPRKLSIRETAQL